MTDKLAEEIIKQFVVEVEGLDGIEYVSHELAIYCMQAYHEAANKQVTDEDIQTWALKRVIIDMQPKSRINTASENAYKRGLIEAATAMRDGKIKPVSRDNDC